MTDHKRIVRFRELIVQDYGDETDLIIVNEGETAFLPFPLNRFQMGRNIGRIGGFNRSETFAVRRRKGIPGQNPAFHSP